MRISDWSSDVCSSDLVPVEELGLTEEQRFEAWWIARFLEMYGTKDQGNPLTEHLDGPRPSVVGRPGAVLWTIQMRMLVPKEASAASSFPDDYVQLGRESCRVGVCQTE